MRRPRFQPKKPRSIAAVLAAALLLALAALAALACAAPAPMPNGNPSNPAVEPTAAAPTSTPQPAIPQAFWDCLLQERESWQSQPAPARWLNSAASASIGAARTCAASSLPPYDPATHPPQDGATLAACFDRERERFLALYPEQEALASADNFFLNGLNQVCYTADRLPEFRFRNPERSSSGAVNPG